MTIKNLIAAHCFFVSQSRDYVGVSNKNETTGKETKRYTFQQKLYWPIAWMKFMYYSIKG